MSDEQSFFGQIKNQIIAGVGVVITAVGGIAVSQIEGLLGVEEEQPAVEQVQPAAAQQSVIINIPEQKKDTVVKKVYVKPKPKKTATEKRKEEIDW